MVATSNIPVNPFEVVRNTVDLIAAGRIDVERGKMMLTAMLRLTIKHAAKAPDDCKAVIEKDAKQYPVGSLGDVAAQQTVGALTIVKTAILSMIPPDEDKDEPVPAAPKK